MQVGACAHARDARGDQKTTFTASSFLPPFGSWASNSAHETWLSHLAGLFSVLSSCIPTQLYCAACQGVCHLPPSTFVEVPIWGLNVQGFLSFSPVFFFLLTFELAC